MIFPNDWQTSTLDNCLSAIIDYRGKTPTKSLFGVPLITAKIVKDGRIETPNEFIAEADYKAWMTRGYPKVGDVVITSEAPLGEVAQLDVERVALAQRIILLRGHPKKLDNAYLKYCLSSDYVQSQLRSRASGTTVSGIKQSELRKVRIALPPIDEQKQIGQLFRALDDKIELNRKMNRTLEAMAQALFKSWFVDFEPVKAKAAGRAPESCDAETAALFPDEFVESELGAIPKGWRVGTLGDVCLNYRKPINPSAIEPNTPYIGLEHMPRKSIALDAWTSASRAESGKSWFEVGDILFGKLRPYFHKVGVAPVSGVCSTDVLVVKPKSANCFGFALAHLSSTELINHADKLSNGAKMPRAKWEDLADYKVALPAAALTAKYSALAASVVNEIRANIHQSRTLATLRDSLLPKLISGQLRIPVAEALAEAAV